MSRSGREGENFIVTALYRNDGALSKSLTEQEKVA
jgi:hypothetical protein